MAVETRDPVLIGDSIALQLESTVRSLDGRASRLTGLHELDDGRESPAERKQYKREKTDPIVPTRRHKNAPEKSLNGVAEPTLSQQDERALGGVVQDRRWQVVRRRQG